MFFGMTSSFAVQRGTTCMGWGSGQFGKLGMENASDLTFN